MGQDEPRGSERLETPGQNLEDLEFVGHVQNERREIGLEAVDEIGHPIAELAVRGTPSGQVEDLEINAWQGWVPGGLHGDAKQIRVEGEGLGPVQGGSVETPHATGSLVFEGFDGEPFGDGGAFADARGADEDDASGIRRERLGQPVPRREESRGGAHRTCACSDTHVGTGDLAEDELDGGWGQAPASEHRGRIHLSPHHASGGRNRDPGALLFHPGQRLDLLSWTTTASGPRA